VARFPRFAAMTDTTVASDRPRPPEGDWLGTPFLRFEREGSLAIVTVDRPKSRNAMTGAMYFGVRCAVDRVNSDDSLAGLVITGTGDVFIPGGDLGPDAMVDDWGLPPGLGMDVTPFESIRNSAKPVVSAVNGLCQGGGLLIAMMSDVAVASDRSTFRAPELLRGIADTGYAQYLPAQIGIPRARDMLLTGRIVTATEAMDWGLVTRLASHDDVMVEARNVVTALIGAAPKARGSVKRIINGEYGRYDRMTMDASLAGGDEITEGWFAFKERRNPNWVPEDLRTEGRL